MNAKEVTSNRRCQPRRQCTGVQAGPEALNRMVLDRDNEIEELKKQLDWRNGYVTLKKESLIFA